jgi:hypothetical protein
MAEQTVRDRDVQAAGSFLDDTVLVNDFNLFIVVLVVLGTSLLGSSLLGSELRSKRASATGPE